MDVASLIRYLSRIFRLRRHSSAVRAAVQLYTECSPYRIPARLTPAIQRALGGASAATALGAAWAPGSLGERRCRNQLAGKLRACRACPMWTGATHAP